MPNGEKFDPYQAITDQLVAMLEAGVAPWRVPWNPELGMPRSVSTGKPYRGINPFLLHMSAIQGGYASPFWATYKAISEMGGQVRKGEKGTRIMFWKQYLGKETDENGEPERRFVLRVYTVFNADQADGITVPELPKPGPEHAPIVECETAVERYLAAGPRLVTGGPRASYAPGFDTVEMPFLAAFDRAEDYYSALFHELTHSTGHADRLARPDLLAHTTFGDEAYSKEELVAEMGAAMLAGQTGIITTTLENSASYLAGWLKVLKADSKLVVQAAAQAQRAADLILGVTFDHSDSKELATTAA